MFANFELCRAGLVKADNKPKSNRTKTGCIACRRRKIKCDETLPVCGPCERYRHSTGLLCIRPRRSTNSILVSPDGDDAGLRSSHSDTRVAVNPKIMRVNSLSPTQKGRNNASAAPLIQTGWLPSSVSAPFNDAMEQRAFHFLDLHFHKITCPSYINPELSIIRQTWPLATVYPVVRNAYIACYAVLDKSSLGRKGDVLATQYYQKTIRMLRGDLQKLTGEPLLSVVLLLHVLDDIQCGENHPGTSHLHAALTLVNSHLSRDPPFPSHYSFLIEACIFQVVVSGFFNNTYHPRLPDDCVSNLFKLHKAASEGFASDSPWRKSVFLGLSHDLFKIAFLLSQIRRRLPLNSSDDVKLSILERLLESWTIENLHLANQSSNLATPPRGMVLTAKLYHLACTLLALKLRCLALQASNASVRHITQKAQVIIGQLSSGDLANHVVSWALMILAHGASTAEEQMAFGEPFETSAKLYGLGHATRNLTILRRVWSIDGVHGRALGLDGLLP